MRKITYLGMFVVILLGMLGYTLPASAAPLSTTQNYTVWVGAEDVSRGVSITTFFPQELSIHVGDSITWMANSHEIHTVTFLAGGAMPDLLIPAPPNDLYTLLQINPLAAFPTPTDGNYDGTTYMNSGIISTDPGMVESFTLTFTQEGTFHYICLVHGAVMSGTINVVSSDTPVLSPAQVEAQAQAEMKAAWQQVPQVLDQARAQVVPPTKNPDGTFTRTIMVGYDSGPIMVMRFFPDHMTVFPGDTVIWKLSAADNAPHTLSFFNGTEDQPLVIVEVGESGPIALINPAVLFPSGAVQQGEPLNTTDYFNSGIMQPGIYDTFSLVIGNISGIMDYECILQDSSGMTASLFVVPRMGGTSSK
jgi:plastocyanin